ncbi:uncharacterized protein PAC_11843 [Phialocephala subalpina]|uniref:Protein NO VEIN C-terminal domain-containing protein n=1 Tax=Phialocephala subalpina TaxID=576137 RepID=A0A1L7XAD9_9HELO|nr:uncharacterized protein PAC_11843 [Phialocephala subalpina]
MPFLSDFLALRLATNLYSKDTRFVYELVQNAEDNSYTRAVAEGLDIYLRFCLYPDKIVIESNEDGFGENHVKAICSTGESTKVVAQGYIGEKGIGFKSVFKVAKKVHIQSGPFSFSFNYTRDSDDDGLGMVTPLDEDYEDLPDNVNTRITLTLLDPSNFEQRAQDLLNIPDTLLLFLTNLDTLYINVYPSHGSATEIQYSFNVDRGRGTETITKAAIVDGESTNNIQNFYVVKKQIINLPHDAARRHTNQATVVLAFPVDDDEEPVIAQQHVFAFLPLRLAGFTFLIQSDFITQASREDVFHSARNESLLSGVAETFRDAVLRFCSHRSLRYKWMRYLPSDAIADEFWRNLRPKVISLLQGTRCLWPWSESSLCLPNKLHWVTWDCKDRHGQPLLADLMEEGYLSTSYAWQDFESLRPLGTSYLNYTLLIERLRADLERPDSKMKGVATEEDWHTRTANLLCNLFTSPNNSNGVQSLRALELIPLQGNRWVSATRTPLFAGHIYLPTTGTIPIPTDLGINLVHSGAVANVARKTLFMHLGVTSASASNIISLIKTRYLSGGSFTLEDNKSHLRYLFWNLPQSELALDNSIFLLDNVGTVVCRTPGRVKYIYFEEADEEYGPLQLFQTAPPESRNAPGLAVHYLSASYLVAVSPESRHNRRSWKQWLADFAGVKSFPQIRNPESQVLSDEFFYILWNRPNKVFGLLKHYWFFYGSEMTPDVIASLKDWPAPSHDVFRTPLKNAFLPLPRLKSIIERLGIAYFPFVILPEELTGQDENEWQFLQVFSDRPSIGTDDVHFYVEALKRVVLESGPECSSASLEALFEVYGFIERSCVSPQDGDHVCALFKDNKFIYIPPSPARPAEWVDSEACVWTGPEWLETKRRLNGVLRFAEREHLFRMTLRIGDATWRHYLDDLQKMKEENRHDIEKVLHIYRRLWREFERDSNWNTIRSSFEESRLVFVPLWNSWWSPSYCIWCDDQVRIPQRAPIKTPYGGLEDFFCRVLGVQRPNLGMHVEALKELARVQPAASASQIKQTMMLISSMDPTPDDVRDLRLSNIFSVTTTTGQTAFTNSTADFAIVDRLEYGAAFAGKINLLDYSLTEVRSSGPLLFALGMQGRHLSNLVEEPTTVQGGAIDTALSRAFRSKAYALFRFTVHYRSPRARDGDRTLYNLFRDAYIYISDGISKSLSVVQYGETVTVENSRANFHLDEVDNELRLYIPRNQDAREECFSWQLPRRLAKYFEIESAAVTVLHSIISCQSLNAVDAILRNAGIIEVDGIERPLELDGGTHSFGFDEMSRALEEITPARTESRVSQPSPLTPSSTTMTISAAHGEVVAYLPRSSPAVNGRISASSAPPLALYHGVSAPIPLTDNAILETGYIALLERVINSASRMPIPARGAQSFDPVSNVQGETFFESIFAIRSVERDRKVGAAGELLAFELLLNLRLFGFNESNWQSTIRKEVRVHNKYRNLQSWTGRETADITYIDSTGQLTNLFIEKGYLGRQLWENQRPSYFLEVKTTTRDCGEQFYMSGSQYQRMQSMKLSPQTASPDIYVLLRVFNLEGRIGLRVYVDPESSRLAGELQFDVDTWAVRSI